ncbi:MAG: hypothetical protein F6K09_25095, partial [Merismopedia sp. SIO2A8]|nr:hypothetical protein [Merismopedia sp. SIO2A8]
MTSPPIAIPSTSRASLRLPSGYTPRFKDRLLFSLVSNSPVRAALTVLMGFSGALFNGIGTVLIVPVILTILEQEVDSSNVPPLLNILLSPFDSVPEQYRLAVMA